MDIGGMIVAWGLLAVILFGHSLKGMILELVIIEINKGGKR